ncbi:hypothetical protein MC885_007705 [Smutsia gigantea]|nr:hypothetical protein MC885_007705 [Smutsia gigantea]
MSTGLCLRPRRKGRVEEWGTGATVRQRKAPPEGNVPAAESTPLPAKKLLFPDDIARAPPAACRAPVPCRRKSSRRQRE